MSGRGVFPSVLVLLLAAGFLAWSQAYDGRGHVVPSLIGWTAVALSLLDLVAHTESRAGRVLHGVLSGHPLDSSFRDEAAAPAVSPAVACLWTAGFVGFVALVGFILAVPVYTLAFMRLQGRMPWRRSAVTAVAVAAVVWIVFERLLRYRVFEGWIFGGQF